jgi:hypothetical protein
LLPTLLEKSGEKDFQTAEMQEAKQQEHPPSLTKSEVSCEHGPMNETYSTVNYSPWWSSW